MRPFKPSRRIVGLFAATAFAFGAAFVLPAIVPAQAQAADKVGVVIRTIHASTDPGGSMDGRLEPLASKLTKAFQGYVGFTELNTQNITITSDAPFSIVLPDGTRFRLDYKGLENNLHRIGVGVGKKFDTDIRASGGSTFFQAGLPFRHNDKDGILIVAITVL